MSDGNYNRNLLPYKPFESGLRAGRAQMRELALKVKAHSVTPDEIARLVAYTKEKGGIEYAERRMWEFHGEAQRFLDGKVAQPEVKAALQAYLDFVIKRNK